MTDTDISFAPEGALIGKRKPRIALMGEFSAGKSTLMNLLLGCDPMPVRITATRVPPVWVTHGTEGAIRVLEDGSEEDLDAESFAEAPVDGTALIRLSLDADILQLCDLIDIPGISDPNMKHEAWMGLLTEIDLVLWCTHATQAWRQSEAALWEQVSSDVKGPNYLVVTQFDKLRADRDKARVLARLKAETDGAFAGILPISTLDAMNAGTDEEAWKQSGGAALVEQLVLSLVAAEQAAQGEPVSDSDTLAEGQAIATSAATAVEVVEPADCMAHPSESRVVPRRVRPKSTNPERPPASTFELTPLHVVASAEEH